MFHFTTQLIKGSDRRGWTYVDIPAEVSLKFQTKGRIKVVGKIDSENFRTSLLPKGDGTHFLFVSQPLLKKIRKAAGDFVEVHLEEDLQPRSVDLPEDMRRALSQSPLAMATYQNFSYSHKKELNDWINEAKKIETRERRIVKMIFMLEKYRKPGK